MADLKRIRIDKTKLYTVLTLDLSVSRDKEELVITGNFLKYFQSTNITDSFSMIFNEGTFDNITFKKGGFVRLPFYRIFISNSAIAGATATIIISEHEDFDCENSIDVNLSGTISASITNTDFPELSLYHGLHDSKMFEHLKSNYTPIDLIIPLEFTLGVATTRSITIYTPNTNINNRYLCLEKIEGGLDISGNVNPLRVWIYNSNNVDVTAWSSLTPAYPVNKKDCSAGYGNLQLRYNDSLTNTSDLLFVSELSPLTKEINNIIGLSKLINYVSATNYKAYTLVFHTTDITSGYAFKGNIHAKII